MYAVTELDPGVAAVISADLTPSADVDFFRRHGQLTTWRKGAVLVREGVPLRGVYLLLTGKLKVYRQTAPGQRQIFHFHRPGDLIGYRALITGSHPAFQAEAIEPCQALFVPAEQFMQHVRLSPSFAGFLLEQQSREFAAWSDNYALMARRPVRQRLAVCLLALHHLFRIEPNPTAVICISRSDLADYAATTLETTVRILREMKDAGLVHIRGRRIVVLDLECVRQLACSSAAPEKN